MANLSLILNANVLLHTSAANQYRLPRFLFELILIVLMMILTVIMTMFIHFLGIILHVAQALHHTIADTM